MLCFSHQNQSWLLAHLALFAGCGAVAIEAVPSCSLTIEVEMMMMCTKQEKKALEGEAEWTRWK